MKGQTGHLALSLLQELLDELHVLLEAVNIEALSKKLQLPEAVECLLVFEVKFDYLPFTGFRFLDLNLTFTIAYKALLVTSRTSRAFIIM